MSKKSKWQKFCDDVSGIYQIQSKVKPKRIYIGSSQKIGNRWYDHLMMLRKNKHYNKRLQEHYNKYGESDLQFSILIGCEKSRLKANEQFFMDCFNPYFNIDKTNGAGYHYRHG